MSVFAQRVFGDGTNTYFTLTNEEFVRKLDFNNGWNTVRIGILYAIQGSGNFVLTESGLGVCAAGSPIQNTLGQKSGSTTIWMGTSLAGVGYGNQTFTYNAGPPAYYSQALQAVASKKGATYAAYSGSGGTSYHAVAGQGTRSCMFIDIIKGTGGATWKLFAYMPMSAAKAQTAYTLDEVSVACQAAHGTAPILRGSTWAYGAYTNGSSFDETGPLDCLNVYWAQAAVPFEVYGIVAYATWQNAGN